MSSSTKIDNRKKDILILGKGTTQGLERTLTAEKMDSINFSRGDTKLFKLALQWSKHLFVNGTEIIKFKAKDSVATVLCLGNILKDWSVDGMRKTGLNRYVYDFSVGYDAYAVDDILDIHKYLIKKNDIV